MAHLTSEVDLHSMQVCGGLGARLGVHTSLFSDQSAETAASVCLPAGISRST